MWFREFYLPPPLLVIGPLKKEKMCVFPTGCAKNDKTDRFCFKAVGEKTGKVLQGQLSELNKKISEVNLQVEIKSEPTGDPYRHSLIKI